MDNGWILIYRQIMDHWIWSDKPFSKGQAWIDLLLLANYEDKKTMFRGKLITCKRGTVNLSIAALANRWGWHWKTTKKFILELEKDNMCTLECQRECTTITLVNYDNFQDLGKRSAKRNAKRNANQSENPMPNGMPITKESKRNVKEEKEKPSADPVQEEEEEIRWNGKRLEDLTEQEYFDYIDSWPDEEEQT